MLHTTVSRNVRRTHSVSAVPWGGCGGVGVLKGLIAFNYDPNAPTTLTTPPHIPLHTSTIPHSTIPLPHLDPIFVRGLHSTPCLAQKSDNSQFTPSSYASGGVGGGGGYVGSSGGGGGGAGGGGGPGGPVGPPFGTSGSSGDGSSGSSSSSSSSSGDEKSGGSSWWIPRYIMYYILITNSMGFLKETTIYKKQFEEEEKLWKQRMNWRTTPDGKIDYCVEGTGSPVVVINAGTNSMAWNLRHEIAKYTTCITFRHEGLRVSEDNEGVPWTTLKLLRDLKDGGNKLMQPSPIPTPYKQSEEIAKVLKDAKVSDDIILVGTHYNWWSTLLFAHRNSGGIAGVFLVDPLLPTNAAATIVNETTAKSMTIISEVTLIPDEIATEGEASPRDLWNNFLFKDAVLQSTAHIEKLGDYDDLFAFNRVVGTAVAYQHIRKDPRMKYFRRQIDCLKLEDLHYNDVADGMTSTMNRAELESYIEAQLLRHEREENFTYGPKARWPFLQLLAITKSWHDKGELPPTAVYITHIPEESMRYSSKNKAVVTEREFELRTVVDSFNASMGLFWQKVFPHNVWKTPSTTDPRHINATGIASYVEKLVEDYRARNQA